MKNTREASKRCINSSIVLMKNSIKRLLWKRFPLPNAESFLKIPVSEGDHQAVHPDICFKPEGWNSYKYWLGITPYPFGDDIRENPSIFVSNDGVNWEVPSGLKNPITHAKLPGFHSDPDIILVGDILRCYYRYNLGDGSTHLKMKESTDGVNWSEEQHVFSVPISGTFASPALVFDNDQYFMFSVNTVSRKITLRNSSDGLRWNEPIDIFSEKNIWHADVIKHEETYYMVYMKKPEGKLFLAESKDRLNWMKYKNPILGPSKGGWDNKWIYRSTFIIVNDIIKVWYSARSRNNEWYTGYTIGNFEKVKKVAAGV